MYLDRKFGLRLSLSKITLLFDLSLDLDRTLAQRKAQRQAKSKIKSPTVLQMYITFICYWTNIFACHFSANTWSSHIETKLY